MFCQLEQESSPANADWSWLPSTWEMITLMHFQWLNFTSWFLTVFDSYYSFCRHFCYMQQKMTPNIYWAVLVLTLPDNKNTWEIEHFWWTSADWTLSLVTGQAYIVTKIAEGILLFVKKWQPPKHLFDASTIFNTHQQNNPENGSFFTHFEWIMCVPFKNNFWKI